MGDAPEGSVESDNSKVPITNQLRELFSKTLKTPNIAQAMKLLEVMHYMEINSTPISDFRSFLLHQELFQEEEKKMKDAKLLNGPSNLYNMSLAHRNKLQIEIQRAELHGQSLQSSYLDWMNKKTTLLDKIHFIIGHGILRRGLR